LFLFQFIIFGQPFGIGYGWIWRQSKRSCDCTFYWRQTRSGRKNPAATATPHYNYSEANNQNNQNRAGSRGTMPLFNVSRRFRPSPILDSNYRRELMDLCDGFGSTTLPSCTPPCGSLQGETREFPIGLNCAHLSPYQYQPRLSYVGVDSNWSLSSHGQGYYGTNHY